MNRLFLSVLGAGTFLSSCGAMAAPPAPPLAPPHGGDLFAMLDSNKDGTITRAEVRAALEKQFAEHDTNHDGIITAAERHAEREARRTARFNTRFDAMDTDKNGQLSREELRAAHDRGPEGRGSEGPDAKGPGDTGPPPPPAPGSAGDEAREGHRFGPHGFGEGFRGGFRGRRDRDADISRDQFLARPLQLFDTIDSNHDGKITPAERDAATALSRRWRPDDAPPKDMPPRK